MPESEPGQPDPEVDGPLSPETDAVQAWERNDLRLSLEFQFLTELLGRTDFKLTKQALGAESHRQRLVTKAWQEGPLRDNVPLVLLHVPPFMYNQLRELAWDYERFYYLRRILPPDARIKIFCKGRDALHFDLEDLIREWLSEGFDVEFVKWSHLSELRKPGGSVDPVELLDRIMRRSALPPRTDAKRPSDPL